MASACTDGRRGPARCTRARSGKSCGGCGSRAVLLVLAGRRLFLQILAVTVVFSVCFLLHMAMEIWLFASTQSTGVPTQPNECVAPVIARSCSPLRSIAFDVLFWRLPEVGDTPLPFQTATHSAFRSSPPSPRCTLYIPVPQRRWPTTPTSRSCTRTARTASMRTPPISCSPSPRRCPPSSSTRPSPFINTSPCVVPSEPRGRRRTPDLLTVALLGVDVLEQLLCSDKQTNA